MKISPQLKGAVKAVAVLLLLLLCLWAYGGHQLHVWTPVGYLHYAQCVLGIQPLGFWLWHERLSPNSNMSDLLERVRPSRVTQYGQWTEMTFVPGCFKLQDDGILLGEHIGVLAREDTIVRAYYGGCTFDREFFDVLSVAEERQRQDDWKQHIEQSQRGRTGQPSPGDDSLKAAPQE